MVFMSPQVRLQSVTTISKHELSDIVPLIRFIRFSARARLRHLRQGEIQGHIWAFSGLQCIQAAAIHYPSIKASLAP
jgi:hypothetical protein